MTIALTTSMTPRTKIYAPIVIAALAAAGVISGSLWSNHRLNRIERSAEAARQTAIEVQNAAAEREIKAAEFKQKIEYLENKLNEIRDLSIKQDEQLEKRTITTRNARTAVERARGKRPNTATADADELCRKLTAAGHKCEE